MTAQRLFVQPEGYEPGILYGIAFGRTVEPVRLTSKAGGASGLLLDVSHQYTIVQDENSQSPPAWRVMTGAYEYRLLDSVERELLVYHWQPGSIPRGPDDPHVPISATISAQTSATTMQPFQLDKRHIPTGRVSLEAVVRMLIAEFGIEYRYRNWATRLSQTEAIFRRELTQYP